MATVHSRSWRRWRFPAASVGIAVFFMVVAFLFGTVGSPSEGVSSDLRKYFIQFFLVTALGALVGIVVYEYRKRREASDRERQRVSDSVASSLRQLDDIYRSVKTTRRLLRLSQARGPNKQAYDEAVLKLDEDQQDLEQLAREVEVLQAEAVEPIRTARLVEAHAAVKAMEEYLGALWSEREDVAALSDDEFEGMDLTRINAFLARVATGNSDFHDFSGKYHEARRTLIALLADNRIGPQPAGHSRHSAHERGATTAGTDNVGS